MISFYLPSGSKIGSGYQAHYMANAMVRRGHRVTMFSPCAKPADAGYEHQIVEVGNSLRTFRFAWRLRRIDFSAFEVLHAHGDDYWLWRRRAPAHVRTMHGSCLAEALHIPRIWEKVRMAMLGCSEVMSTFVADKTVCVSANTRRQYPWVKKVILNGVDTSAFRPGGKKAAEPTILFVGTLHNRKRGAALLEAFEKQIRPVIPGCQMWMVCPPGPEVAGVNYFQNIPTEALCDLYRRAWVFCLPSSYEGFGVPYIEAMASGTPVVATPNPGAVEVLGNGNWGRITAIESLGETIIKLLLDPGELARLRSVGLERSKGFDWNQIVAQYEAVYARSMNPRDAQANDGARAAASVANVAEVVR